MSTEHQNTESGSPKTVAPTGAVNARAVGAQNTSGLHKPLTPMTSVIVVVLALVLIGMGYKTLLSHMGPPPPTELYHTINALAAKCHGDFKNLSPADQATVRQMTPSDPAPILARAYQHPF